MKAESKGLITVLIILAVTLLGFIVLPGAVTGQTIADTVRITIVGNLTTVEIIEDYPPEVAIGDTIHFHAEAFDEEGDPVLADFTWISVDTTKMQVFNVGDGTALGIALSKPFADVAVRAEPIMEILLASFRDGRLNWTGHDTIFTPLDSLGNVIDPNDPSAHLQYCAYAVRGRYLVTQSPGPPTCPIVFTSAPLDGEPFSEMWRPFRARQKWAWNALLGDM